MKCPTDQTTLLMSERSGIEIDYCPECRGVWLDRGELDKILDRAAAELAQEPAPAPVAPVVSAPAAETRGAAPGGGPERDRLDLSLPDFFGAGSRAEDRGRGEQRGYEDRGRGYGGHDRDRDRDRDHGYGSDRGHDRGHGSDRGYGQRGSSKQRGPMGWLGELFD